MKCLSNKISNFVRKEYKSCFFICLSLLSIAISYQAYSTNKLVGKINIQQNELIELKTLIAHDKDQIGVLVSDSQDTYKEIKKLKSEVASLLRRTDEVQQYQLDQALNQKREEDAKPSYDDINNLQSQLVSLQFQIKDLNQKIYELNKLSITSTVNKQAQISPLSMTVDSQIVTKEQTKPALKSLVPPFSVLGIESRGGELFVSVAPSKSYTLNQVRLLRTGDSYRSWQLRSIRNSAVVFNIGARQQVITIN